MLEELVKGKVYYKIFDKSHDALTHKHTKYDFEDLTKAEQVKYNIAGLLNNFDADNLLLLNQVHGNKVVCDEDFMFDKYPEGDASVTTKKNIVLAIRTADCVPILLTNEYGDVIGSAHCGWRSAKLDIIDKLVKTMKEKSKGALFAVIGPSIAQASYEVSKDFYKDFVDESLSYKSFFIKSVKDGHYMFNLPAFVKHKLEKAGAEIIKHIDEDTYVMEEKYPSYRRHTHKGYGYEHNILSAIVMK